MLKPTQRKTGRSVLLAIGAVIGALAVHPTAWNDARAQPGARTDDSSQNADAPTPTSRGRSGSPDLEGGHEAEDPHAIVRGMTVSCQTWGWEWGTDEMVETMRELKGLGVNWIAIHPYARIHADGAVTARRLNDPDEPPRWLTRPIEEAHRLGLKIMIKPHIAYWGSPFEWRGDITFDTEEEWTRFFATYHEWITTTARICAGADAFVVGTELDQTIQREDEWREIIDSVRAHYDAGPITYAANWDAYDRVPFWDALDVIGIQAYFPILDDPARGERARQGDAGAGIENLPDLDAIDAGWARIMNDLNTFAERKGKRIVFTELGYNESSTAPYVPWDHRQGGPNAREIQKRCLDRALKAIADEPAVTGAFLWKWFPGSPTRGNYAKARPHTREVIAVNWSESR